MAVTKREQQMLDLSDQGLTHQQIADRMGIKVSSAARSLANLSPDFATDRKLKRQMIAGSRELAARIGQMERAL